MSRIAAVSVFYNPGIKELSNIDTYLNQVDKVFIVDNSDAVNEDLYDKIKCMSKVEYIYNNGNLGIAAALNIGAEKAINEGYEYLLTMDQDSEAPQGMVDILLECLSKDSDIAVAAPVLIHKTGRLINNSDTPEFEQVYTVWTSGNLVNLDIFKLSGGYREDFFIDYVDHEFCLRLNQLGYKVYLCNRTALRHSLGKIEGINLGFRKVYPTNHSPLRLYYRARNRYYVKRLYGKQFPGFFKEDDYHFWKSFIKALLFEKKKLKKLKYFIGGYIDFRKNKLGKTDKK